MKPRPEDIRTAALAAGELDAEAAAEARAALADSPRLGALYDGVRNALRAIAAFREDAGGPPAGIGDRVLGRTLPVFRRLYGRRSLWPVWLSAAAAAAALVAFQPPPVPAALDELERVGQQVVSFASAAGNRADQVLAEWNVVRASMGVALEDGADEVGERIQELEEAARHRNRIRDREQEEASP